MYLSSKSILLFILLAATFVSTAAVSLPTVLKEADITLYDDSNFTDLTGIKISSQNYKDGKLINNNIPKLEGDADYLVLLYSDRCIHCHIFITTIYKSIKPRIDSLKYKVIPAALQCRMSPKTCKEFNIASFPTIYYFRNDGKVFMYPRASRTIDTVMLFVQDSHAGKEVELASKEPNKFSVPIKGSDSVVNMQNSPKPSQTFVSNVHPQQSTPISTNKQTAIDQTSVPETHNLKKQTAQKAFQHKKNAENSGETNTRTNQHSGQVQLTVVQGNNTQSYSLFAKAVCFVLVIGYCYVRKYYKDNKNLLIPDIQSMNVQYLDHDQQTFTQNSSHDYKDSTSNQQQKDNSIDNTFGKQNEIHSGSEDSLQQQNEKAKIVSPIKQEDILQEINDEFD